MTSAIESTEADILARVLEPEGAGFSADLARAILSLKFADADKQRMHELAQKAQRGELNEQEQYEIDSYERVGHFLNILQAKARIALKGGTQPA